MNLIITNTRTYVEGGKHAQVLAKMALRYKDPNAAAIKRKTGRKWDGYRSMHDGRKKSFSTGLLPRVEWYLAANSVGYTKIDQRVMPKRPSWPVTLSGIDFHGYQTKSITTFLNKGQGILKLGTGAGKTECAVAITKACGVPTIFLTHRVNLMYQAAERYALRWPEAKSQIGIVGNGQFDLRHITFATVQTLHSAIKTHGDAILGDLKHFGLLIIDEAHRVGAKQFHQTADWLPGCYWRLGLTATPFMHEDPRANLQLEGTIGQVIHEVSPSELIEAGVLARPYFKFFNIDQPKGIKKLKNWRDIYEEGIVNNVFRNQVIINNTSKLIDMGHKPLVIVQETGHGKTLAKGLYSAGKKVLLITGKDDVSTRIRGLNALAKGRAEAIISTNIFDEGIDVKDVSAIVLAAGTKSAPSLFQRTGRAIRKKDDGGHAVIIDFIDNQHKTLVKHSLRRYELVSSEPSFKIM